MIEADKLHMEQIAAKGHSARLTFLLLAQYCTFRSQYQPPDVALRMLELYEETWLADREHGLQEIAWLSQEMGMYD